LCESQNAQFSELNESLGHLSSQVVELKSENDKLQKIISSLSKRVQDLESSNSSCRTSLADTIPSIFQKITERKRSSQNVIIRGAQESSSSVLEDRVSNDVQKITETIKPYFPELPSDFKVIRLG
jgi:predicted  nucleic acid-binding Zn-ribbon protein